MPKKKDPVVFNVKLKVTPHPDTEGAMERLARILLKQIFNEESESPITHETPTKI